jgi:hypothetical protein
MTTTTPSILGQSKPVANTDTNLFTVSYGNQAQFNIFVCNQSGTQDQITISLVPNGDLESSTSYIFSGTQIAGNFTFTASGIYLNSGDQVRVISVHGTTSFTATGLLVSN